MDKLADTINGLLYIAERIGGLDTDDDAIRLIDQECYTKARDLILLAESLNLVKPDFRNQWSQLFS